MIEFATMCIGKDWSFEWKDDIRKFQNKHKLHLLTDCSEWFEFKHIIINQKSLVIMIS